MDQVHVIRHKVLVERRSARQVAREMGVSRNTVKAYLARAVPVRVERAPRATPVRDKVGARLEALLAESSGWTAGKQRLTAARLHTMLLEEGFTVGATLVKDRVREWKRQRREVFVPLDYPPGDLGEVDFFEVIVDLAGKRQKAWMFVLRLMHSKRDFACLYARQDQVAFLDGHVRAFAHFGFVPQRIAYDNLKAAVRKHLVGSERLLASRFEALSSHYLFEACFCRPRTGHDKGGVEARGKAIRWQHLVPIPKAETLTAMRSALLVKLDAELDEERFGVERTHGLALSCMPFDARKTYPKKPVSSRALVSLEGATYSVPCAWAGLDITAYVGVDDVTLVGPSGHVTHARGRFGEKIIDYRHYVPELAKKPQAVRQVASKLLGDLGPVYQKAWRALVDEHGPKQAARLFAKVLGHVEARGVEAVAIKLEEAMRTSEPLLLALAPPPAPEARVTASQMPIQLRDIDVQSGSAADYDTWLRGGAS